MIHILQSFALGAFGAAAMEFLKLRELYGKLHVDHYSRLVRAPLFWTLSVCFVVFAGVFTVVVHHGSEHVNLLAAALTGAGFRTFGREGLGAVVHNAGVIQGESAESKPVRLRDVLA